MSGAQFTGVHFSILVWIPGGAKHFCNELKKNIQVTKLMLQEASLQTFLPPTNVLFSSIMFFFEEAAFSSGTSSILFINSETCVVHCMHS